MFFGRRRERNMMWNRADHTNLGRRIHQVHHDLYGEHRITDKAFCQISVDQQFEDFCASKISDSWATICGPFCHNRCNYIK